MNTPHSTPVPILKLPLPENWREMKARDLFDLRKPLAEQVYNLDEIPGWRERAEQAEAYKKTLPEFRFPELMKLDKAAHYSFFWNGVRAPLPPNWQSYGRPLAEWEARGYGVGQHTQEQQAAFDIPPEAAGGANGKLTILTPSQIMAFEDDPADILLANGYIERGSPFVFCGPPGIGKSRLALQLAIKSILGEGFLGWDTNAAGARWLFLQSENGMRRLKADLCAMTQGLTTRQRAALDAHLFIHGIVTDTDGDLNLSEPAARRRVVEAVQDYKPNIVIGDPLTGFGTGDLNSDQDMLQTARDYGRIVREGDPKRIPGLLHHARTGKEAKAGVAGADRGSYARNSKALYGWTRSQVNLAAVNQDNNDKLLFASGKCNNAPEFAKFIIGLDLATMFYAKTAEDPDAAMAELQGEDGKFKPKFHRKQILDLLSSAVARLRKDIKIEAIDRLHMSGRTFDTLWAQLKEFEEIEQTGDGKWLKK